MNNKLLLVDFENVPLPDLGNIGADSHVIIFVGASQKNVPINLVVNLQKLGDRVEWQRVDGNGSNALDFHIACHLGRVIEKSPDLYCIVLSKDKGFDPLIRSLNKSGLKCKRINCLTELEPRIAVAGPTNYQFALERLSKMRKESRPRKRSTLINHISSMFQKKLVQTDIDQIIDLLFVNKMISEANNVVIYSF